MPMAGIRELLPLPRHRIRDHLVPDWRARSRIPAMGMSYKIDQKGRVVLTRGWGVLTTRELVDLTSSVLVDARFDPTYSSLADLRDVTDIEVDHMVSVHTAVTPLFAGGTRRAIVASSDVAYESAQA